MLCIAQTLHWRHNDHDGVSNHQPHGCLLNRLFRRRSKKTSKLRVTGLCVGNSPWPVNSPHKGPVMRKMVPFDDVMMIFVTSQYHTGFDNTGNCFECHKAKHYSYLTWNICTMSLATNTHSLNCDYSFISYDDVIKWKHFLRYWPFVWGIHRSPPRGFPSQRWLGALMFPLTYAWINDWANNRAAGYLRRHSTHYNVTVIRRLI